MSGRTPDSPARLQLSALETCFFLAALLSLGYAVATAPGRGVDLILFQQGAQNWLDRTHHFMAGPIHLYPPFALPLLSPLTLMPMDDLLIVWLGVNLTAAGAVLYLTIKLWGGDWPRRACWYLGGLLLVSAPFRVTLRNGQISLIIMALLLGALLARRRNRHALAGILLGLGLAKYSLTLPFLLYFVWKREWRIAGCASTVVVALTEVFALRLELSPIEAVKGYIAAAGSVYLSAPSDFIGTTEIKSLLFSITGGDEWLTSILKLSVSIAGLISMGLVFQRKRESENAHFAALALFALWFAYHRTYDSVLSLLSAALLIDNLVKGRHVLFSRFWLAALGLFAISIPGLLTERLHFAEAALAANPVGWLGLHIESLIVFVMFWSLLLVLWRETPVGTGSSAKEDGR